MCRASCLIIACALAACSQILGITDPTGAGSNGIDAGIDAGIGAADPATTTLVVGSAAVADDGLATVPVAITVHDAAGNPVAGAHVGVAMTGSASIVLQPTVTAADGTTAAAVASHIAGTLTVHGFLAPGPGEVPITQTGQATFLPAAAPAIASAAATPASSGCVPILLTITQPAARRANLLVEVDAGSGFHRVALAAGTPTGVYAVSTSATGVQHTVLWNATADLGANDVQATLRITPSVDGQSGTPFSIGPVTVDGTSLTACPAPPTSPIALATSSAFPGHSVIADVNRDGIPDIVQGGAIYLGLGDGTFASLATSVNDVAAVADLDGDGLVDLVELSNVQDQLVTQLGRGDGSFATARVSSLDIGPETAVVADLDQDGIADAAAMQGASFVENEFTADLVFGNGDGTFGPPTDYPDLDDPWGGVSADLNDDGRPDLALTSLHGGYLVLLGTGGNAFGSASRVPFGDSALAIAAADLDGDGHVDLVVPNGGGGVYVALGHGDGTFAAAIPLASPAKPLGIAIADLDGDGHPDLVVSCNQVQIATYHGHGDGTFDAAGVMMFSPSPGSPNGDGESVQLADVNGDGRLDIVTGGLVILR